jgi:hypothetical protein
MGGINVGTLVGATVEVGSGARVDSDVEVGSGESGEMDTSLTGFPQADSSSKVISGMNLHKRRISLFTKYGFVKHPDTF